MGALYSIATFVVMSINYNYFTAQSQYIEASKQFILLSRDAEETLQMIILDESTLESQVELLAGRSLPFNCCQSEYAMYLSAISEGSAVSWSDAAMYRLSESLEQFLRATYQALLEEGEELDKLLELRNRVVPTTAIILLLLSLIVAFFLVDRHLVTPMGRLGDFVRASFRGAEPKAADLSGAVSELQFLQGSFESFIAEYRGNLLSRGQRATEMSQTSDALEGQFQRLIEISERPALILDAGGAIRTWNKRMVALTGISKSQANRSTFSEELLAGSSAQIFDDAFQIARSGGIPDEFKCQLILKGGRSISLQLQLSPQIESTLGVNRVLVVVNSGAENTSLTYSAKEPLQIPHAELVAELSTSMHWLEELAGSNVGSDVVRQRAALATAIEWVGSGEYVREQSTFDLAELVAHFASTFEPKLLDLDFDISLDVEPTMGTIMVSGNAGSVLIALEKLCDNALEAIRLKAPAKGRIVVKAYSSDSSVARISLKDNGIGVLSGNDKLIFEPFFTTKAADGHFGLGLTHSRDLIQHLSGRIFAVSGDEGPEGLEMVIELPLDSS